MKLLRRLLPGPRYEKQTCPERVQSFGPWERIEGIDTWKQVGPDRKCSFCGSMHPQDFLDIIDRIINDEEDDDNTQISLTDKRHKVYVNRKSVKNAGEGAIKFYMYHFQGMSERDLATAQERFNIAAQISRERLMSWINENVRQG